MFAAANYRRLSFFSGRSLWCVWGVWICISLFFSFEPLNSSWTVWKQIVFLVFILLSERFFSAGAGRMLMITICAGAVVAGTAVLAGASFDLAYGILYPNRNYTASIIAAAAGCLFSLSFEREQGKYRFFYLAASLLLFAVLLSMRVRGALIAVITVYVIILLAGKQFSFFKILTAAGIISILAALVISPAQLGSIIKIEDIRSFQRLNIWSTAVKTAMDYPVFGVGPGCFERGYFLHNFPVFDGISFYGRFADHAHNEPLNMAVETGWLGAFLFIAAFWKSVSSAGRSVCGRAGRAMAVVLFAEAFVDGIFMLPAVQMLFGASLGCCTADSAVSAEKTVPRSGAGHGLGGKNGKAPGIILGILLLFGVSAVALKKSAIDWSRCADSAHGASFKKTCLERMVKIFPADFELFSKMADMQMTAVPANPAAAAAFLEQALAYNPTNAGLRAKKGWIYFLTGNSAQAERDALKAVSLEPNMARARLLLAQIYFKKGDIKKAQGEIDAIARIAYKSADSGGPYNASVVSFDNAEYMQLKQKLKKIT